MINMGDRANIGFRSGGHRPSDCVWLYTHNGGSHLARLAKQAIEAASNRWDDPHYATRIALTEIIGDIRGDTGWGIDTEPGDNEHDGLVIDWENSVVHVIDANTIDSWYELDDKERLQAFVNALTLTFRQVLASSAYSAEQLP